jgi:hypothetical protein
MRTPLPAPTTAPVSSVAITTSHAGKPSTNKKNSAAKLQSAKIAPTLKSIPPEIRLNAMPSATKPNSANSRISERTFASEP